MHRDQHIMLLSSSTQIIQHLRHYTEPMFQRYILRIIFMVPVYAACSFASLLAENAAIYITTIRDWCVLLDGLLLLCSSYYLMIK